MASQPALFDAADHASRRLDDYRAHAPVGDVACAGDPAPWLAALAELAQVTGDDLSQAAERVQRHAAEIGNGVPGGEASRLWPLSPVPLLLDAATFDDIARGVAQRAELQEAILTDLYSAGRLVADGHLPAALVTGSPHFLRPLAGLIPPGGYYLHLVAYDLARDPDGTWRVLGDQLRGAVGAGIALENRLALGRTLGGLQARLNVRRHAPFFAAFRDGLAARCRRAEPRIGLLTPGRGSPSYAEQAQLARHLGFLLVEGADLAALEDKLYLRTIGGLKRIDALWRRLDARLLDPLAFDSHSQIGVAGLIDAYAAGNTVLANAPGAGMLEAPAFAPFLPGLAEHLTGAPLHLPGVATWWCGQDAERAAVEQRLGELILAPAFGVPTLGLGSTARLGGDLNAVERAALLADLARRPHDYVAQEAVRLSTMPAVVDDTLAPRPFTLRVYAARAPDGTWQVMPGGLARLAATADPRLLAFGPGAASADVAVHGDARAARATLLATGEPLRLRRSAGTLPSRVADNFFWLGRYLERAEALLAVVRVLLGNAIDAAALPAATLGRLVALIGGAAPAPPSLRRPDLIAFARGALEGEGQSVRTLLAHAARLGEGARDRLSADTLTLLEAPWPNQRGTIDRAGTLQRRFAALTGLAAEHMGRGPAWRFMDWGRRIERALAITRALHALGLPRADADDLSVLLDLADSQISYRQRYLAAIARVPVVDLVALDPGNPRSLAFQGEAIAAHAAALPVLDDDGMAEPQQVEATAIRAALATAQAASLDDAALAALEQRLLCLSDAIARRYFLHGAEPLRAGGLTLA